MARSRISITIPGHLVAAADRRAREIDRSRSWVIADALAAHLAPRGVAESSRQRPGLAPARRALLEEDLDLTPLERVLIAEETARVAELRGRRAKRHQVVIFDDLRHFLDWERREGIEL